ncbi:MAG: DUF4178 domain-containing protein [Campylobacterota bacterium]|nr:DUF4178 domain-containing protein [Campylobacterota bacterium]
MKKHFDTPYKTVNCPQCGAALPLYFVHAKLAQCQSCGSSIFLDDEAARVAGESSVLAPEPSLITLNHSFGYAGKNYLPVGMVRYSYGRGFWEEWWIKDNSGEEFWLSVDEGDMVLEQLVDNEEDPSIFKSPSIGQRIGSEWIITEIGTGECEGFSGSLPMIITQGQKHKYLHLSGYNASLKTIEVDPSGIRTYIGRWIDPFDIKG